MNTTVRRSVNPVQKMSECRGARRKSPIKRSSDASRMKPPGLNTAVKKSMKSAVISEFRVTKSPVQRSTSEQSTSDFCVTRTPSRPRAQFFDMASPDKCAHTCDLSLQKGAAAAVDPSPIRFMAMQATPDTSHRTSRSKLTACVEWDDADAPNPWLMSDWDSACKMDMSTGTPSTATSFDERRLADLVRFTLQAELEPLVHKALADEKSEIREQLKAFRRSIDEHMLKFEKTVRTEYAQEVANLHASQHELFQKMEVMQHSLNSNEFQTTEQTRTESAASRISQEQIVWRLEQMQREFNEQECQKIASLKLSQDELLRNFERMQLQLGDLALEQPSSCTADKPRSRTADEQMRDKMAERARRLAAPSGRSAKVEADLGERERFTSPESVEGNDERKSRKQSTIGVEEVACIVGLEAGAEGRCRVGSLVAKFEAPRGKEVNRDQAFSATESRDSSVRGLSRGRRVYQSPVSGGPPMADNFQPQPPLSLLDYLPKPELSLTAACNES